MSQTPRNGASRRGFLAGTLGVIGAAGVEVAAPGAVNAAPALPPPAKTYPFHGAHQQGIITPAQRHVHFAALDVVTEKREELIAMLRAWTEAAARMTAGLPVEPGTVASDAVPLDCGDVLGMGAAALTVTIGFGPGLFTKDGQDRFGIAQARPDALIDMPKFNGDQLVPERTGGDIAIQACADDPQVAFHAVRQLTRLAEGAAQLRWVQPGFSASHGPGETPRNLMGFKDGTRGPATRDPDAMARHVWVGSEGGWMRGGSYMVARPIRIALEHWDRMKLGFQEETIGRRKISGAAIGKGHEHEAPDFAATDADGNPLIAENAHIRHAAPETNGGAQILRRGYSYDNGLSFVAERWPPWRQGLEFDAGLMFICFQRNLREGFVKVFENMAKFDMLNQFTTHVGGGFFACPPGVSTGQYLGQPLFEST